MTFVHAAIFCLIIRIQYIILMTLNVSLQTRDDLEKEVINQGLNIIHSVSFPTDQDPQPLVQKLQVSVRNEDPYTIWLLVGNHWIYQIRTSVLIGVKWKDYSPKLLPRICTWDSLPSKYWLLSFSETSVHASLSMCCRPPHWAWCPQGMHGSYTDGILKHFGSRAQAIGQPTRSLISAAKSRLWAL